MFEYSQESNLYIFTQKPNGTHLFFAAQQQQPLHFVHNIVHSLSSIFVAPNKSNFVYVKIRNLSRSIDVESK